MKVAGASLVQIQDAADQVGVHLYGFHQSGKGTVYVFTLKTVGPAPRYRRFGRNGRTLPGRVCWHGVRDFLRALFARVPDARVRTAMATYNGAADFERHHRDTFDVRSEYMGYMMAAPADQPCACEE